MASKLMRTIQKIHHSIKQSPQPTIIYIGVGAACGLINENGLIDDKNYHEYPMFLQQMQERLHSVQIHIILIDPLLTEPPYSVKDHSKNLHYHQTDVDIYTARTPNQNTVNVYCIRDNVYIDGQYVNDGYVNITQELFYLNEICMSESIFFVFNDFCGRSNKYVAELYDEQIYAHLDHIIYGLGARKDVGCYIDVTGSDCVFPFKLTERNRPMIKVFNIYNYLDRNQIYDIDSAIAEYYGDENIDKISGQIHSALEQYISDFKGKSLTILKNIYRVINCNEKLVPEFILESIHYKYRDKVNTMIHSREYQQLYDFVFKMFAYDLDIVLKLKQSGGYGEEMLRFITRDPEPNKWYNELRVIY